jgi:hypothetical protein
MYSNCPISDKQRQLVLLFYKIKGKYAVEQANQVGISVVTLKSQLKF